MPAKPAIKAPTLIRWEWESQEPPPREEMVTALASLPPVWKVETVDFAVHVLPMSQAQTIYLDAQGNRVPTKRMAAKEGVAVVWKLYMQVAGRLAMLNRALDLNEWEADFIPDSSTGFKDGIGLPAFVGGKETIYREFVALRRPIGGNPENGFYEFGRRPGMASLKASGRVPPWEKLETAARGRALGAWGFGVLPGSGLASLDEMELASLPDAGTLSDEPEPLRDRESIEHDIFLDLEQYKLVRGRSADEGNTYLRTIILEVGGKDVKANGGRLDLSSLSDPQAELVRRRLQADLSKIRTEASPL